MITLKDYQIKALKQLKNGSVLCGDVGSGKSLVSVAYYYLENGGDIRSITGDSEYWPMDDTPCDLYIITTARKRDTYEWDSELAHFLLSTNPSNDIYKHKVVIDSWNNIKHYQRVTGAFFIFDEQRVVGNGAWVKAFLKIAKRNRWILLSATPGDKWEDYIPLFVANGFYRNKTEFNNEHAVWSRYSKYPKIERYVATGKLIRHQNDILVPMDFVRKTKTNHIPIETSFDILKYKEIGKNRWDPYQEKPIENASALCYIWRRVVNTDESKQVRLLEIFEKHPKIIVFYNFDYELDILRNLNYGDGVQIAEWNGHKHEPIPDNNIWVYLVQYMSGAEGWNCIETDTIIFYSENYSYRLMKQASGRIDRMNTSFTELYYYYLRSKAPIDIAIYRAINNKRDFNISAFVKW